MIFPQFLKDHYNSSAAVGLGGDVFFPYLAPGFIKKKSYFSYIYFNCVRGNFRRESPAKLTTKSLICESDPVRYITLRCCISRGEDPEKKYVNKIVLGNSGYCNGKKSSEMLLKYRRRTLTILNNFIRWNKRA